MFAVILVVSIASLNVIKMLVFIAISIEESAGLVEMTVGAVVSVAADNTDLSSSSLQPFMANEIMSIEIVKNNA